MGFVDEASGFKKVYGVESARATVALVPSSVLQDLIKAISATGVWIHSRGNCNVDICPQHIDRPKIYISVDTG